MRWALTALFTFSLLILHGANENVHCCRASWPMQPCNSYTDMTKPQERHARALDRSTKRERVKTVPHHQIDVNNSLKSCCQSFPSTFALKKKKPQQTTRSWRPRLVEHPAYVPLTFGEDNKKNPSLADMFTHSWSFNLKLQANTILDYCLSAMFTRCPYRARGG